MRFLFAIGVLGLGCSVASAIDPLVKGPAVQSLSYSADGTRLVAASGDIDQPGHATVWQMPAGKLVFHHEEVQGIPAATFSPDGRRLVLGAFGEHVLVIDTATWKAERRLSGHGRAARDVVFSHDGKTLAVASHDGFIHLWDTATWTIRTTLKDAHKDWIVTLAFSGDDKTLASGGIDSAAKLWDLGSGKELKLVKNDSISRRILFTPDDRHVIYLRWDGSLSLCDRHTGNMLASLERSGAGSGDVAVSADGKLLAAGADEVNVYSINLKPADETTVRAVRRLMKGWDDDQSAVREQASKDMSALGIPALAELAKVAKETSSPEIRLRARLARAAILTPAPILKLRHPEGAIQSVAFSPDGHTLATGGVDGIVRLWGLSGGQESGLLRQFKPMPTKVRRSEY